MSIAVTIRIGGQPLMAELDDEALAAIAAAVEPGSATPPSPLMTIPEAADYLRCKRQRIDDLCSSGQLDRIKDGRRTLIRRADVLRYLKDALD